MIRLPAGLQFQEVPRVVGYALLATALTAALFAADGAYRWYQGAHTQVAAPLTGERSVETPDPAPVSASASPPETGVPARDAAEVKGAVEPQPVAAEAPAVPGGAVSNPVVGTVPDGAASAVANVIPEAAGSPANAPSRLAPPSPQLKPRQARTRPARQATRERAAPRGPVHAATKPPARAEKPNVYWERDSQLGFAPQLRKRTCNPATGQMPMQCYYPREGREKFPAKSVN